MNNGATREAKGTCGAYLEPAQVLASNASAVPDTGPLNLTRSTTMNKKVAVILSGCGVYDGSEIYESVITLLRLDQRGVKVQCFAPNIAQMHEIGRAHV